MDTIDFFKVKELGTSYAMPTYRACDTNGIVPVHSCEDWEAISSQTITFVRKTPRVDGILHQQLLVVLITDLEYKNSLMPNTETSIVISKLKEALFWMGEWNKKNTSQVK